MSLKLAVAHFTNGADVAFVQGKYEATFLLVLGKAKKLRFSSGFGGGGMGWVTEEQWAAFCLEVLPQCASLEKLYLNGNANLKVDIVELVAKLPPTLKKLDLEYTGCFGDAGKADWARLPALEGVVLEDTKVTWDGDIVELVAKLPPTLKVLYLYNTGCFGDAGKADWARLPALEWVWLDGTKVTGSEEDLKAAGCAAWFILI